MIISNNECEERPYFFFSFFIFFFPTNPFPQTSLLCFLSLKPPVLLIRHCIHVWFFSVIWGYVWNHFWIMILLNGVIYMTLRLFTCKIIFLANFASLVTSKVPIYTGNSGADCIISRVEIIHLISGGIWIWICPRGLWKRRIHCTYFRPLPKDDINCTPEVSVSLHWL